MGRKPSGIRFLEEQLRFEGKLPPSKRELLKTLREEGKLPPTKKQMLKELQHQDAQHPSYERAADKLVAITPVEYSGLQEAFDHFNSALFEGVLPDLFMTYQRKARSAGYYSPGRFSARDGTFTRHELALNPDLFINQTDEQVMQTLVHEMTHHWQHSFGAPPKRHYHNQQWSTKMKAIGLQPSSTGMVGGKEVGAHMSDYIIPDGPFTKAFAKLAATGWRLNLQSAHRPGPKGGTNNSKTTFTCTACGQNAWGKPDLAILCEPCGIKMRARIADVAIAATPSPLPLFEPPPSYEPAPPPSYEMGAAREPESVKRKRGRPKGSKNKPKMEAQSYEQERSPPVIKRKRGRPKNKAKVTASASYEQEEPVLKRKRGRPKGSKNKPKAEADRTIGV